MLVAGMVMRMVGNRGEEDQVTFLDHCKMELQRLTRGGSQLSIQSASAHCDVANVSLYMPKLAISPSECVNEPGTENQQQSSQLSKGAVELAELNWSSRL